MGASVLAGTSEERWIGAVALVFVFVFVFVSGTGMLVAAGP
ncbi:hypothetical protein ACMHYB_21475 [Sorangium sp. So ce1128]